MDTEKINIGRVAIDAVTRQQLFSALDDSVRNRVGGNYVCFCDAHLCVRANRQDNVLEAVSGAMLILPDGVAATAGAVLLGKRFPKRMPGPSVMLEYCAHGVSKGIKHFFYGGTQGVAQTLAENLQRWIPGINVVGTYSPPFRELSDSEESKITEMLNQSGADVVWVALGAPKQELWMYSNRNRIKAPLMMGVGAAFDFHSGSRKWAPFWVRKAGLEWIYRMLTGGKRVFFRNAKYDFLMACMLLKETASSLKKA